MSQCWGNYGLYILSPCQFFFGHWDIFLMGEKVTLKNNYKPPYIKTVYAWGSISRKRNRSAYIQKTCSIFSFSTGWNG